jgi:hypothetical protein
MIQPAKSNPQLLDEQIFSERLHPRFLLSAARTGPPVMSADRPQNQFDFPDVASLTQASRHANRVRQKLDFMRRFNVIWVV